MHWTCSETKPSLKYNSYSSCDNIPFTMSCPIGQYIESGSFKYGRWDNNICPGPGVNSSTTLDFDIFELPVRCLQGVNSCDFGISNSLIKMFGDPFLGVAKHVRNWLIYSNI